MNDDDDDDWKPREWTSQNIHIFKKLYKVSNPILAEEPSAILLLNGRIEILAAIAKKSIGIQKELTLFTSYVSYLVGDDQKRDSIKKNSPVEKELIQCLRQINDWAKVWITEGPGKLKLPDVNASLTRKNGRLKKYCDELPFTPALSPQIKELTVGESPSPSLPLSSQSQMTAPSAPVELPPKAQVITMPKSLVLTLPEKGKLQIRSHEGERKFWTEKTPKIIEENKEQKTLYCILCKKKVSAIESITNLHYQSCWFCGSLTCVNLVKNCPECDFYCCIKDCLQSHQEQNCKSGENAEGMWFLVDTLYKQGKKFR